MEKIIKNDYLKFVVSTKGAESQELIYENKNYFRTRDEYWDRIAPFLFPNVGRLRDNQTYINGKLYNLPQHGFLRDQEFDILLEKENEISLVNVHNDDTYKMYPFNYKAIVTYKLKDKSLITTVKIINEDHQDMPFNLGGHPGFHLPMYDNEIFNDYKVIFDKKETFLAPSVESNGTLNFKDNLKSFEDLKELELNYKIFEKDALVIPRVKSKEVLLVNKNGKGIKFAYPSFMSLAIWTRPNAPFVCLEPWVGYADRHDTNYQFIEKDNIVVLKPLEEFQVEYTITLID